MKGVILAAGLGSRLRPITNSVPKCMVKINGQCIIDKQINNLIDNGIPEKDIIVIGGYKEDKLYEHLMETYPSVCFISNKRYAETNNMYSLFLASEQVKGKDFLLMNADVFYDSNIITGLLETTGSSIACDKSTFLAESMKITLGNDERINHISKQISETDYYAVSIDVYKVCKETSEILFSEIYDTIVNKKEENSWTEVALDSILPKTNFHPYLIKGRWVEIDDHSDLRQAETIFNN